MMFRFIFAFSLVLFLSTHYAFTHQSKTTYFQRIEFLFVESFRPNVQAASTTLTGIHSAAADPDRPVLVGSREVPSAADFTKCRKSPEIVSNGLLEICIGSI
jgi:hypothetical protein